MEAEFSSESPVSIYKTIQKTYTSYITFVSHNCLKGGAPPPLEGSTKKRELIVYSPSYAIISVFA
jgi:hypothetical protein